MNEPICETSNTEMRYVSCIPSSYPYDLIEIKITAIKYVRIGIYIVYTHIDIQPAYLVDFIMITSSMVSPLRE